MMTTIDQRAGKDFSAAEISSKSMIVEPSIGQLEYIASMEGCEPSTTRYYMIFEARLAAIETEIVESTVACIIQRHESMRTIFPVINGKVSQVILPYDPQSFGVSLVVLTEEQHLETEKKRAYADINQIFSKVAVGPLVASLLFHKAGGDYFFAFLIHHLICDDWSLKLIEEELIQIFTAQEQGLKPTLASLPEQLRHYCADQNAKLKAQRSASKNFWRKNLTGFHDMFSILDYYYSHAIRCQATKLDKADHPQNEAELTTILDDGANSFFESVITDQDFQEIKYFAGANKFFLAGVMYSSFILLIHLYARRSKVLTVALIADRGKPQYRSIVGCLLGATYLPAEIQEEDTLIGVIERCVNLLWTGVENIIFSHEYLDLTYPVLRTSCHLYINYISNKTPIHQTSAAQVFIHQADEAIYYPLNFLVNEYTDGFLIRWRYNANLFSPEIMEDIVNCHRFILSYITANAGASVNELKRFLGL